jgi:hypothetical protein
MLELVALRARPDLMPWVFSGAMQAAWPEFMQHDPAAQLYFGRPHLDACLDTAFAVVDPARPEVAVGRTFAVPLAFGTRASPPGRSRATVPFPRTNLAARRRQPCRPTSLSATGQTRA